MASKTGWTHFKNNQLMDLFRAPCCKKSRRITVRIDPAPEQMTRAELQRDIKAGWWVLMGSLETLVTERSLTANVNWFRGAAQPYPFGLVTSARPHDEAEWIKVTD